MTTGAKQAKIEPRFETPSMKLPFQQQKVKSDNLLRSFLRP